MNRARCRDGDRLWSASEFNLLLPADLDRLRRHLECPGCGARAYYRGRSRDGRAACFGSSEHRPGCPDATTHGGGCPAGDSDLAGLDVIRVQTLSPAPLGERSVEPVGENDRRGVPREIASQVGAVRRSLRTLLRHIVSEPTFLYSDTRIEAAGCPVLSAKDFFVRFEQITDRHLDQERGYWGTVISYGYGTARRSTTGPVARPSSAQRPSAGPVYPGSMGPGSMGPVLMDPGLVDPRRDVWLNAGPPGEPSVLVRAGQVADLARANLLTSWEDLIGCPVLVLGRCVRSRTGKVYIGPLSTSHMAFLDWD